MSLLLMEQSSYPSIPYYDCSLHHRTVDDRKQGTEMPEHHTAANISEKMTKVCEEWGISNKVTAFVRNNASNINLAMQFLGDWGNLPCFGHTLQLAVNSELGLAPVSRLTAVCCKLVIHFKHSVVAMDALREKQQNLNIPQHIVMISDVATRWNSTILHV